MCVCVQLHPYIHNMYHHMSLVACHISSVAMPRIILGLFELVCGLAKPFESSFEAVRTLEI